MGYRNEHGANRAGKAADARLPIGLGQSRPSAKPRLWAALAETTAWLTLAIGAGIAAASYPAARAVIQTVILGAGL